MGAQNQMFWTLVGFWAWLLCGPGFTAAVPVVTEWQEGEDDYISTETLPWGSDSDYFEPTTMVVSETAFAATEKPQTTAPFISEPLGTEGASEVPGENPGSADETSPSSPVEKEAVNSVPNPTQGNIDPTTDGPSKLEIPLPEEITEDATEVPVTEKEALVNANSSSSSLSKGAINITKEVSEETATSPILLSKGTPSAFLGEEPEVTERVTDAYSGVNDPALPTVTSNRGLLASTSGEERIASLSGAEGETSLDTATREINTGSGLNPTIRSWEETTDATVGPNDDTLEPSPDASSEAAAPSLSSEIPSSNPEVLSGHLLSPLPESDAVTAKPAIPSKWPPSDLTSTSETISESLQPSELATVSLQSSPEEKADLGVEPAPATGRGDADSFTASDLDAEPTAIGSSSGPDVSLESTAEVPTEESEDLVDAEAPSPVNGAVDTPSGSASSSDSTSRSSDLDFETTAASPIRLSTALDSSAQLPEDGEEGAASPTKGQAAAAEEGSGSANSNEESPFASSSLEPNPSASGTEIPNGEDAAADLDNGATSSLLNSGMETTSSELADTETATTSSSSSKSETSSASSSEVTLTNPAGAGDLPDTETPVPSGPDDEVAAEAQGASGGSALPTSLPDVPSESFDLESGEGESSPSGVPGNVGSSEDSTAVTGSTVVSGSAVDQEATTTRSEGQSGTDLPPSDPELGPVYASQLPVESSGSPSTGESPRQPPVESAVTLTQYDSSGGESPFPSRAPGDPFSGSSISESDETEPSPDGSLVSSQPPPGSDTEASEGTEELQDIVGANAEETSNVLPSPEYESAPAGTGSLTGGNVPGDQDSGAVLPSQDQAVTPELAGNEETLLDGSGSQDEISTIPPEAQLGSGDAKETSTSFARVSDAKSGELVDSESSFPLTVSTGTSEAAQGPSQETTSSVTPVDAPSGSSILESEEGEAPLSPSSGIFGPSPQDSDPTEGGGDEGEDTELAADDVGVTTSSGGLLGNAAPFSGSEPGPAEGALLPAEESDTLADGESSPLSAEEEEMSLTNMPSGEESPGSASVPSGEKSSLPFIADSSGAQPSASSGPLGGSGASLPSPDNALTLGSATSEKPQELEDPSNASGEKTPLIPMAPESQPASPSTEEVESPASGSADGTASQSSLDDAAGAGPGGSEGEGQMAGPASPTGGEASLAPSAAESQPASPSTEGVDSPASGLSDNKPSQPSPDDAAVAELGPGASEGEGQVAGSSSLTEGEASLGPSAAESQSTSSSTEGVDSPASGLSDNKPSQPSPDDAAVAELGPGASEGEGQMAGSSSLTEGEASLGPSAAESQPASSSTEGVDSPASVLSDNKPSQPSPDDAAVAELGPGASEGEGQMAGSSSLTEGEASLAPSAAESQSTSSSTEGVESPASGPSNGKASQPSPDDAAVAELGPGASEGEGQMAGSSSLTEGEASLGPSAAESQSTSSSTEGVDSPASGPSNGKASQPSPDDAAVAELGPGASEGEGQMAGSSSLTEGEASLAPSAAASQSTSSSTEGVDSPASGPSNGKASQPSPDDAAVAELGPGASEGEGQMAGSSSLTEGEASLAPSAAASQSTSSSTEGVDSPASGPSNGKASQPSPDDAAVAELGPGASEGEGQMAGSSSLTEGEASLGPSAAESQSTSSSTEGVDSPASGLSNGKASQPSPDGAAIARPGDSGGERQMDGLSAVSGKETLLGSSVTESQSPGTPAGGKVSEGLGNAPLPAEGMATAESGPAASRESTSTEAGLSPESAAEQPVENSVGGASLSPSSSVDESLKKVQKLLAGPLASGSTALDGRLVTGGVPNQVFGSMDSSQPASGSQGVSDSLASPDNTGSVGSSVLASGEQTAPSNTLGGLESSSAVTKAGAEIPTGSLGSGTGLLGGDGAFSESSVAGGPKIPIVQPAANLGISSWLYPGAILPLRPSGTGAESAEHVDGVSSSGGFSKSQEAEETSIGKEAGIASSFPSDAAGKTAGPLPNALPGSSSELVAGSRGGPAAPGVSGGSVGANKGPSATSTGGETPSSLSGTVLSPAKLPAGESGPELKAGALPPFSKAAVNVPSGKSSSVPASPSTSSSGSKASKSGLSATSSISSQLPSSSKSEPPARGIKGTKSSTKASLPNGLDAPVAASGAGLSPAKSTLTTSKTSSKKPDAAPENPKKGGGKARSDDNTAEKGPVPAVPVSGSSAASLFPYGPSANDKEYVERKVDFNSPLFRPEIGVPLGKTLRNSLYFTDNGQIIFPASDKDISSYPNPPPKGFDGREKVPMIAVFSDNADFSRGSGTTFYQEYVTQNSAKPPLVQAVEAKIQQYMKSSYSARWTLKITWVKTQPYMAQKRNGGTNTYQAILTTDGYRTYALFLYQEGGMKWDYSKLPATNVLIGYTSGDGYFRTDDLMNKMPAEKYRPDRFEGYNTGVRGLWLYKLPSRIQVNYRQRCLDWLSHEGQPSAWNKGLPRCPCSLKQARSDKRYTQSKKGLPDSRLTMLYSSTPNKYGAGVRCLYNNNNQLVEGHQERIWKDTRKSSPYNDEELKLYDWCCNQAGNPQLCDKYNQKRPRVGCDGYRPPVQN